MAGWKLPAVAIFFVYQDERKYCCCIHETVSCNFTIIASTRMPRVPRWSSKAIWLVPFGNLAVGSKIRSPSENDTAGGALVVDMLGYLAVYHPTAILASCKGRKGISQIGNKKPWTAQTTDSVESAQSNQRCFISLADSGKMPYLLWILSFALNLRLDIWKRHASGFSVSNEPPREDGVSLLHASLFTGSSFLLGLMHSRSPLSRDDDRQVPEI